MAVSFQAASTAATGQASVAVVYPTVSGGILVGDYLLIIMGGHNETPTFDLPTGWDDLGTGTGGTGTYAADVGPCRVQAFGTVAVGAETGSQTVTITGSSGGTTGTAAWGLMLCYRNATGSWLVASAFGADNTAASSWSVTFSSDPGIASGDHLVLGLVAPTDTLPTFGAESVTAAGATIAAVTAVQNPASTTGRDIGGRVIRTNATAGTSTAAPVHTIALSGTTTNYAGPEVAVRLRESTGVAHTRSQTDAEGLSDTPISRTITVTITETCGLADSGALLSLAASPSSVMNLTDSASTQLTGGAGVLTRQVDDNLGLTDAVTAQTGRGVTDAFGITDTFALGFEHIEDDDVLLSDTLEIQAPSASVWVYSYSGVFG